MCLSLYINHSVRLEVVGNKVVLLVFLDSLPVSVPSLKVFVRRMIIGNSPSPLSNRQPVYIRLCACLLGIMIAWSIRLSLFRLIALSFFPVSSHVHVYMTDVL